MNSLIFVDNVEAVDPGVQTVFRSQGTDATGTLNAWVQDSGAWSIATNVVTGPASATALMHAGHAEWWDGTFSQRLNWITASKPKVIIHFVNSTNYIYGQIDGANLTLHKLVANVDTTVATIADVMVTATFYWLQISAVGTLYTVTTFNDNAGAIGTQRQTTNATIADVAVQFGTLALGEAAAVSTSFGGAFANVCRITAPVPLGWTCVSTWTSNEPAFCWTQTTPFVGSWALSISSPVSVSLCWWLRAAFPLSSSSGYTLSAYTRGPIQIDAVPNGGAAEVFAGANNTTSYTLTQGTITALAGTTSVDFRLRSSGTGTAYADLMTIASLTQFRGFASLPMDDNVTGYVTEVHVPSVRDVQSASIVNRRRMAKIREDTLPQEFEVRGVFLDNPVTGVFWRDFKAALLNQIMQPFDHGDGTEFRAVDVTDVAHARAGVYQPPLNRELMVYTAKCLSYEPYARSKAGMVTLSPNQALTNGNGTFVTNLNVYNQGTAPGEPTWQVTLVIPNGVTVTQVRIQNTTTGETCTTVGLSLTNGTFLVLMDACGGGNSGNTPNNNAYGLLGLNSNGYGITVSGAGDSDFVGTPPTLAPASGAPPVPTPNSIAVSITATAVLTSATLNYVAPARWIR